MDRQKHNDTQQRENNGHRSRSIFHSSECETFHTGVTNSILSHYKDVRGHGTIRVIIRHVSAITTRRKLHCEKRLIPNTTTYPNDVNYIFQRDSTHFLWHHGRPSMRHHQPYFLKLWQFCWNSFALTQMHVEGDKTSGRHLNHWGGVTHVCVN